MTVAIWDHDRYDSMNELSPIEVKAICRYRDGYLCTECGITTKEHVDKFGRSLDVHRLIPGSKYTIEGCVTLCRECHHTKPKSPRGTRPRKHFTISLHPAIYAALEELAARNRRPVEWEAAIAIEEYLAAHKLWPPASQIN